MYKKIISVMSVMLMVFLCSYVVYADETYNNTRYYAWSSTTNSYGNVDIRGNLFTVVNQPAMQSVNMSTASYVGGGTTTAQVATWESVYLWKFNAAITVTNNGSNYEIFDGGRIYNTWSITAKASSNTSGNLTDDIIPNGFYIDNVQGGHLVNATSTTMIFQVDDNTYQGDFILAPGESISITYDINLFWWEQSFGVGGTNFTCTNGSVGATIGYSSGLPDSHQSLSMTEFLDNNNDVSINAYIAANTDNIWNDVQTLVSQGVYANNDLDDIIQKLTYVGTLNLPVDTNSNFTGLASSVVGNVRHIMKRLSGHPQLIDSTIVLDPSNDTSYTLYSYEIPVIITIYSDNGNTYDVRNSSYQGWITLNLNNNDYTITDFRSTLFDDFGLEQSGTISLYGKYTAYIGQSNIPFYIPKGRFITVITLKYYYQTSDPTYVYRIPAYSFSYVPNAYTEYNSSFSEQNTAEQQVETQVHSTEQSYFSQGNTALGNTGIDNYSFSQEQSGGISGVSNDFVRVWNACGSLNSVWIFALTLSLALYIVHHVPKQRS